MSSKEVNDYYSTAYYSYQELIVKSNPLIIEDYEMILQVIKKLNIEQYIIDVGSGNCRWYVHLADKLKMYFGVDTCGAALSRAHINEKLKVITADVFDNNTSFDEISDFNFHTLFCSFFLSHFNNDEIAKILNNSKLSKSLLIVDSFWGDKLKKRYYTPELTLVKRRRSKEGAIMLPKRFFNYKILDGLLTKNNYKIDFYKNGTYWFICFATRVDG